MTPTKSSFAFAGDSDEVLQPVYGHDGKTVGHVRPTDGPGHFMAFDRHGHTIGRNRFTSRDAAVAAVFSNEAMNRARRGR